MTEYLRSTRGSDEHGMHPVDAAEEYEKQTLTIEQLFLEMQHAREKHGAKWADEMHAQSWAAEPDELLFNMIDQLERAGRTFVRRVAAWHERERERCK